MKRNSLALAAGIALALGSSAVVTADASFVNTSAAAMLQGQATSRWQPDRFGPIVSSDTLWSIAMYYGDQTDLSVYEMMDLFIELNPEAFINGRADRMMDGYYLKVPEIAQRARAGSSEGDVATATTDSPKVTTSDMPETQAKDTGDVVNADTSVAAADSPVVAESTSATSDSTDTASGSSVEFDVAELTQLRTQLAESISLIERLNAENSALQQRLDSVNAELEQLRLKVDAEQVAEDKLQEQIAAEIIATKVEAGESAEVSPKAQPNEEISVSDEQSAKTEASSTEPEKVEPKAAEPKAAEPKAAEQKPVKRKQQSEYEEFLDWLMQPFQLTLAILVPLLLAAIIWYVLYVRRLNRETLGPYNGAMQAAEQEQQEQGDSEEKLSAYEEAEQAALAEDAADMPEFERLDDEGDEVVAQEAEDSLDDELNALDSTEDEFETIEETVDEEADLDTLLASSFDEEETETTTDESSANTDVNVEPTVEVGEELEVDIETESTEAAQPESSEDDLSIEFDTDFEQQDEPKDKAQPLDSESSDDDEMSLDFHIDDTDSANDEPVAPAVDEAPVADLEVELEQFENVDLDDIDLEALTTEEVTKPEAEDDSDDAAFLEIDALLEEAESADSDFDSPRFERESGQLDDNEETPSGMIDLARAYLEMDEYELARNELEKVAQTDDEDAKREAAMLLQKIEEQGH